MTATGVVVDTYSGNSTLVPPRLECHVPFTQHAPKKGAGGTQSATRRTFQHCDDPGDDEERTASVNAFNLECECIGLDEVERGVDALVGHI